MASKTEVTAPPIVLLRRRDAARALAISERFFLTLTQRGEIPCVRISDHCVRFRLEDLVAWAARVASTSREASNLIRDGGARR